MTSYQLTDKTFRFSLHLMDLYVLLLKNQEFELAEKSLRSGLLIREKIEEAIAAPVVAEYHNNLSEAANHAVQTRYWIKMIQMKHFVNNSCDTCVESINELINILHYLSYEDNGNRLNMQYQLN
jgi:four helix bundle protein